MYTIWLKVSEHLLVGLSQTFATNLKAHILPKMSLYAIGTSGLILYEQDNAPARQLKRHD